MSALVFYICDGKACKNCSEECSHTSKVEHAVNGACENPQDHPERFQLKLGLDKPLYFEKEK